MLLALTWAISANVAQATVAPTGFSPSTFTAIGESDWWVLGGFDCGKFDVKCRAAVLRTTNGGRSFDPLSAPTVYESGYDRGHLIPGATEIAFANNRDGWAIGTGLWATHNGGRSWIHVSTSGAVDELVTAGGYAYAVFESGPVGHSGDPTSLWRSPVQTDHWTRLTDAGAVSDGLAARGDEVFVQSAVPSKSFDAIGPDLLVSHDYGERFARYRSPNPNLGNQLEPTSGGTVWDLGISGGPSGTVFRSTNGGRSFSEVQPKADDSYPNSSTVFAAASSEVALLSDHTAKAGVVLYRTSDCGTSWKPTGPTNLNWEYLGFTDATHGAGIAASKSGNRLYYTTNAGLSYRRISFR